MRNTPNVKAERYRLTTGAMGTGPEAGNNGAFFVPCGPETLKVIASDGLGWDHVSVSLPHRCPTWAEMCFIKQLFFRDDETVIQYHPAKSDYVNYHPHCLHLWRPHYQELPKPPTIAVGPSGPLDIELALALTVEAAP